MVWASGKSMVLGFRMHLTAMGWQCQPCRAARYGSVVLSRSWSRVEGVGEKCGKAWLRS